MRRLARSFLREVIVEPIRAGHPQPKRWPAGVGALVTIALGLVIAMLVVTVLAPMLRSTVPLVETPSLEVAPEGTLQLLFIAVIIILILLQMAGLHGGILLTLGTSAIMFMSLSPIAAVALDSWWFAPVIAWAALLAISLWRRRRPFRWWEVPLVTVPILFGTLLPLLSARYYMLTSMDLRGVAVQMTLVMVTLAAAPALVSAGFAASDISLRAADWVADRFTDSLRRSIPWVTAALVACLVVELVLALQTGPPSFPSIADVAGSLIQLAAAALLAIPVWWLARGRQRVEATDLSHLRTRWEPTALGLGLALALYYSITAIGATVTTWGSTLRNTDLFQVGMDIIDFSGSPGLSSLWIVGFSGFLWVAGLLSARRGHVLFGLAASVCLASSCLVSLQYVTDGAVEILYTSDSTGMVSAAIGIALLLRDAITPVKEKVNVAALLLIGLPIIYHFRFVLAEPFTALIGASGAAIVVVGLAWDTASGWDVTERPIRGVPEASRALLMAASLLAAAAATAYAGLSRSRGGMIDTAVMPTIGDGIIGSSLYVAALMLLAVAAFHPKGSPGRIAAGTTHPSLLSP